MGGQRLGLRAPPVPPPLARPGGRAGGRVRAVRAADAAQRGGGVAAAAAGGAAGVALRAAGPQLGLGIVPLPHSAHDTGMYGAV